MVYAVEEYKTAMMTDQDRKRQESDEDFVRILKFIADSSLRSSPKYAG